METQAVPKEKVFLFAFNMPQDEKEKLDKIVRKLGGISRVHEDMYVSDATHVVIPDDTVHKWCPKLMGALAGGKTVVRVAYLIESDKAGTFLEEAKFVPNYVENIILHVRSKLLN